MWSVLVMVIDPVLGFPQKLAQRTIGPVLAKTHAGEVLPLRQPLDVNSSNKLSLLATIIATQTQLRKTGEEASIYMADNGVYSEANMKQLNQIGVKWGSRVSETMTEAKTLIQQRRENWRRLEHEQSCNPSGCDCGIWDQDLNSKVIVEFLAFLKLLSRTPNRSLSSTALGGRLKLRVDVKPRLFRSYTGKT